MPTLESSIDRLYQGPLGGFIAARTALARSLSGGDAQRVKALQKPTVVPWAVNQVYWHARPLYDRVIKSGAAVRAAQIAALGGRSADVRKAAEAHRTAIAGAVKDALRLAASGGVRPSADALSQVFEALSLAVSQTEPAGRLSQPLRPAGFEALAGVTVKPPAQMRHREDAAAARDRHAEIEKAEIQKAKIEKAEAEIEKAETAFARAQAAEASARAEWERRKRDRDEAEQVLARLRTR
jgi:hypothetical protein